MLQLVQGCRNEYFWLAQVSTCAGVSKKYKYFEVCMRLRFDWYNFVVELSHNRVAQADACARGGTSR